MNKANRAIWNFNARLDKDSALFNTSRMAYF